MMLFFFFLEQTVDANEQTLDDSFFSEVVKVDDLDDDEKNRPFNGFLRYQLGVNLEDNHDEGTPSRRVPKLTKAKTRINAYLQNSVSSLINYKLGFNAYYDAIYLLNDSSTYTPEQKKAFEFSLEMSESYFSLNLSDTLSVSIGRLISAWGQSEASPVVDVVNPRDLRELGQTGLEEMRLPVGALKLNYTASQWLAEFVFVFEFRGNKMGVYGSDFDPYLSLRHEVIHQALKPYRFAEDGEFYVRLKSYLSKGEIAVMGGDGYDKSSILKQRADNSLSPEYQRIQILGASGNRVWKNWLSKFELAYKRNKAMQERLGWSKKDVFQSMFGLNYTGLSRTGIMVEWNRTYIKNYTQSLLNNKVQHTYALFLSRTYLNERLSSDFAWFKYGLNDGDVFRLNLSYECRDNIQLSLDYFVYRSSKPEAMLYGYRNSDRLVSTVSYYF